MSVFAILLFALSVEIILSLKLFEVKINQMKKFFVFVLLAAAFNLQAQSVTGKIGYADMEYIMSQLPDMKQIETELKSTQAQFKKEIDAKSQKLQKDYGDFNTNAKTMTDTLRINSQRKLEESMAALEQFQQNAQTTLQNKQKLLMAPLFLKVNKAINEVATENGFSVILTKEVGNYQVLLHQSEQLDVSNLVLKKFGVTPVDKPAAK